MTHDYKPIYIMDSYISINGVESYSQRNLIEHPFTPEEINASQRFLNRSGYIDMRHEWLKSLYKETP